MLVHKAGTSFIASVTRTTDAGVPVDLASYTIVSKLKNRETGDIYTLTSSTSGNRVDLLASASATASWTPGLYDWDVLFTASGTSVSVPSFQNLLVNVVPGVSSGA